MQDILSAGGRLVLPLAQLAGDEGVDADAEDDCGDCDQEGDEDFGDGVGSQIVGLLSAAGE